ncbi:hypothetical protein [Acanthopleuribacter pedis]|uniref:Uncharacterized protein n=1 Tax=Acanthopleuribacter pedis TaxID=442870 RepID=A0A8J7QHT3_9BACT|nr:hypothetical protein [Acanthopleuribacter pedis]MBO1320816.1 hypothetical protein [Acanthopleuribacter pedis]
MIDFSQQPELRLAALQAYLGWAQTPVFLATRGTAGFHWHYFNATFRALIGLDTLALRELEPADLLKHCNPEERVRRIAAVLAEGGTFSAPCSLAGPGKPVRRGTLLLQVDAPDNLGTRAVLGFFREDAPVGDEATDNLSAEYQGRLEALRTLLGTLADEPPHPDDPAAVAPTKDDALEQWVEAFSSYLETAAVETDQPAI